MTRRRDTPARGGVRGGSGGAGLTGARSAPPSAAPGGSGATAKTVSPSGSGAAPKGVGRAGRPERAPRVMPGGAEVIRAERRAAREGVAAPQAEDGARPGEAIIRSAWVGTALFVAATAVAVAVPSARIPVVVVDLALFLVGSGLYLWGWGVAAGRSRENQISLWNLILLEDVAPRRVRAHLLGALAVQVAVAAATCWIANALAFGWLVPVWGLAHCEYWGARYGVFLPRPDDRMPRRRQR